MAPSSYDPYQDDQLGPKEKTLRLLSHAANCQKPPTQKCNNEHCKAGKAMLQHIMQCKDVTKCKQSFCAPAKFVLKNGAKIKEAAEKRGVASQQKPKPANPFSKKRQRPGQANAQAQQLDGSQGFKSVCRSLQNSQLIRPMSRKKRAKLKRRSMQLIQESKYEDRDSDTSGSEYSSSSEEEEEVSQFGDMSSGSEYSSCEEESSSDSSSSDDEEERCYREASFFKTIRRQRKKRGSVTREAILPTSGILARQDRNPAVPKRNRSLKGALLDSRLAKAIDSKESLLMDTSSDKNSVVPVRKQSISEDLDVVSCLPETDSEENNTTDNSGDSNPLVPQVRHGAETDNDHSRRNPDNAEGEDVDYGNSSSGSSSSGSSSGDGNESVGSSSSDGSVHREETLPKTTSVPAIGKTTTDNPDIAGPVTTADDAESDDDSKSSSEGGSSRSSSSSSSEDSLEDSSDDDKKTHIHVSPDGNKKTKLGGDSDTVTQKEAVRKETPVAKAKFGATVRPKPSDSTIGAGKKSSVGRSTRVGERTRPKLSEASGVGFLSLNVHSVGTGVHKKSVNTQAEQINFWVPPDISALLGTQIVDPGDVDLKPTLNSAVTTSVEWRALDSDRKSSNKSRPNGEYTSFAARNSIPWTPPKGANLPSAAAEDFEVILGEKCEHVDWVPVDGKTNIAKDWKKAGKKDRSDVLDRGNSTKIGTPLWVPPKATDISFLDSDSSTSSDSDSSEDEEDKTPRRNAGVTRSKDHSTLGKSAPGVPPKSANLSVSCTLAGEGGNEKIDWLQLDTSKESMKSFGSVRGSGKGTSDKWTPPKVSSVTALVDSSAVSDSSDDENDKKSSGIATIANKSTNKRTEKHAMNDNRANDGPGTNATANMGSAFSKLPTGRQTGVLVGKKKELMSTSSVSDRQQDPSKPVKRDNHNRSKSGKKSFRFSWDESSSDEDGSSSEDSSDEKEFRSAVQSTTAIHSKGSKVSNVRKPSLPAEEAAAIAQEAQKEKEKAAAMQDLLAQWASKQAAGAFVSSKSTEKSAKKAITSQGEDSKTKKTSTRKWGLPGESNDSKWKDTGKPSTAPTASVSRNSTNTGKTHAGAWGNRQANTAVSAEGQTQSQKSAFAMWKGKEKSKEPTPPTSTNLYANKGNADILRGDAATTKQHKSAMPNAAQLSSKLASLAARENDPPKQIPPQIPSVGSGAQSSAANSVGTKEPRASMSVAAQLDSELYSALARRNGQPKKSVPLLPRSGSGVKESATNEQGSKQPKSSMSTTAQWNNEVSSALAKRKEKPKQPMPPSVSNNGPEINKTKYAVPVSAHVNNELASALARRYERTNQAILTASSSNEYGVKGSKEGHFGRSNAPVVPAWIQQSKIGSAWGSDGGSNKKTRVGGGSYKRTTKTKNGSFFERSSAAAPPSWVSKQQDTTSSKPDGDWWLDTPSDDGATKGGTSPATDATTAAVCIRSPAAVATTTTPTEATTTLATLDDEESKPQKDWWVMDDDGDDWWSTGGSAALEQIVVEALGL